MKLLRQFIAAFVFVVACSANYCGKLSTFNAVCKYNSIVYILSANPCNSNTSIGLSVVYKTYYAVAHINVSQDILVPYKPLPLVEVGVILEMHPLIYPKQEDYRLQRLHVSLYIVDLESKAAENKTDKVKLLDVMFPMFPDTCEVSDKGLGAYLHNSQEPHTCTRSIRTGQYSTLCYHDPWEGKHKNSLYFLALDPCTVPPSAAVIGMFDDEHEFVQTFTESKLDAFVPARSDDVAGCGLKLHMHLHDLKYHVTLARGCLGLDNETVNLIDDYYHSELGMLCPLTDCIEESKLNHSCRSQWISGRGETRNVSIRTMLIPCTPKVELYLQIQLQDEPVRFEGALVASHEEDMRDRQYLKAFRVTTGLSKEGTVVVDATNNGYLGLDGGNLTLYVHESRKGLIHAVVLRHYPEWDAAFPVLHDEFWVTRVGFCRDFGKRHGSDRSMTVVAIVVVVAAIAIIVFFVLIVYLRRRASKRGAGLPYEIHLEDEFRDDY